MSHVGTIARNDVAGAFRSRGLWGAVVLMTAFVLIPWLSMDQSFIEPIDRPMLTAGSSFVMWVPLVAIVLGYRSVVGERESGRIRVFLGLSSTRSDVVFGKLLGRSLVLFVVLFVSMAVITVSVVFRAGSVDPVALLGFVLLLFLYGLAWTGATVGSSTAVSSTTRAVAIVVGLYALTGPLWQTAVVPILARVFSGRAASSGLDSMQSLTYADGPAWYLYGTRLSPFEAFEGARYYVPDLLDVLLRGDPTSALHGPNLFGLAVLVGWALLPVAVGSWRFERFDLG